LLENGVDTIEPNKFSLMTAVKIYLEKEQEKIQEKREKRARLAHIIHGSIEIKDLVYCIPTYSSLGINEDECDFFVFDDIIRGILGSDAEIKAKKYYDHFVKTYGYEELVEMNQDNLEDYIKNYDMNNYIYFFKDKDHYSKYIISFIDEFNVNYINDYFDYWIIFLFSFFVNKLIINNFYVIIILVVFIIHLH